MITYEYEELDNSIFQQKDNLSIRNKIVMNFTALVASRLKHFSYDIDEIDDIISEGVIGLIKAVEKFDPTLGYQFSSYAVPYIDGYIKEYFKKKQFLYSLDDPISEDATFLDLLEDEHDFEEEIINQDHINYQLSKIYQWLAPLPEGEQTIYKLILQGQTLKQIATDLSLSKEKVRQIVIKVERYLTIQTIKER